MEKAKRKSKSAQSGWLRGLFAPATIDFVAYLPLEECAARLKSREKTGFWRPIRTYVALIPVDESICDFEIKRTGNNRYGTYIAEGYLQAWDEGRTHITGDVKTGPHHYDGLAIIFTWLCLVSLLCQTIFFALIMGIIIFTIIYDSARMRNDLASMIEATLGY
jgi:hypothetical protein